MDPVLFLDFDGVLHPVGGNATGVPFSQVPMLEALLREARFSVVRIVISSTWARGVSLRRLRRIFSADIGRRIIDITPRGGRL